MAGHSKWANTRHRKAAQDAKRGKIFTKIIRELVTAAKLGGGAPDANPRLRAAIDKALSNNMTRDTLNRAIARGVGGDDDANMETIIYEGYGPGGTAIMIECLSDTRNRTVAEVRHAFSKCGGNLGTDGSVAYLFSKKGEISFEKSNKDTIMEAALQQGIWAALYIYLFFRMLKENAAREEKYQAMIDSLSTNIAEGIEDIQNRLDALTK